MNFMYRQDHEEQLACVQIDAGSPSLPTVTLGQPPNAHPWLPQRITAPRPEPAVANEADEAEEATTPPQRTLPSTAVSQLELTRPPMWFGWK
jgi:hypothetical protein